MAENRADKLKRLVAVQRHLERMAEIDLAGTTRQRSEVAETMETVMNAINSLDPLHRGFSHVYSERFGRLQQSDRMLANVQQMHEMRVVRERAKGDRLEERLREARTAEDRTADDASLGELIDRHVAARWRQD